MLPQALEVPRVASIADGADARGVEPDAGGGWVRVKGLRSRELDVVHAEPCAWFQLDEFTHQPLVVIGDAWTEAALPPCHAGRRREHPLPVSRAVRHGLYEDLGVRVVVGVAVGHHEAVKPPGAEPRPVGEHERAGPRIDVDLRLALHHPDAGGAPPLGGHHEPATARAQEMQPKGLQ